MDQTDANVVVEMIVKHQDAIVGYTLKTIGVIFLLWLTFKLGNTVRRSLAKALQSKGFDATISNALGGLLRLLVIAASVVSILGVFGINTASFAAVLASLGLAVGLALQGALGNFAAGVLLLIFRPFKSGDVVNVAGQTGSVVEIDLCNVTLDTPDNRRIIVPNGSVFGGIIENITHHKKRRVDVTIGVSYDSDLDRTREVLQNAVSNLDGALENPPAAIILSNLGESSVDWTIRVYCKTSDYWNVREKILYLSKQYLDASKIDIPYPHMTVEIANDPVVYPAGASK